MKESKKNIVIFILVFIIIVLVGILGFEIYSTKTNDTKIEEKNPVKDNELENETQKETETKEIELTIKPNEKYNLLAEYKNDIIVNSKKYVITNYFYYEENVDSTSDVDKYILYREAYINNKRVIELSGFGYPQSTNTKNEVAKYINNQKISTISDIYSDTEYLLVEFVMHHTDDKINIHIYDDNLNELVKIPVKYGFTDAYLIFDNENEAKKTNGYDNSLAENGKINYMSYSKRMAYLNSNNINYISIDEGCNSISEYTLTIKNGQALRKMNKTYYGNNIYIGEDKCF